MEDSDAALAAALAFIDSFEEPASALEPLPLPVAEPSAPCTLVESVSSEIDSTTGESLERTSSGSDSSPGFDSPSHERPRGRRTRLKKSTALASKRLREKKKQEMAALVEEAAVLEARLAHLQKRAMDASTTQAVSATGRRSDAELVARVAGAVRESVAAVSRREVGGSWLNAAANEAKERWKSEALNLELRHALEDQVRLADALRGLIQGHAAGQSVLSALDKFQRRYPERAITSLSVDLISDLQVQVARQYLHVDTVIQPLVAYSASSTMQTKRDFNGQLVVEITTTTPVACSLRDAIKLLAAGMDTKHVQGQKVFLGKHTCGDATEKRYVLEIPSVGSFDASAFSRRFPESDRYVIVWGATAIPRCRSVMIREKGWMMVSSRHTPAGPISYAQTCLQATVSRSDGTQVHDVDTASLTALNEWCIRAQVDCQLIQNVILEESGKMGAMVPGLDLSARV